jgi:magnesium transporter
MNDETLLSNGEVRSFAEKLAHEHVADIVETLNEQPVEEAARLLDDLPFDRAVDVLDQPGLDSASGLVTALDRKKAADLMSAMSADRATEIFRNLDEPARTELLGLVDQETHAAILRLLSYPPESAGSIMTTEFVSAPANWTIARTLQHIRNVERTRETVYSIYVVDPKDGKLLQSVSLRSLISGEPDAPITSIGPRRQPIIVSPLADREKVAHLISKYDLLAVPVVERGRVIGIVTVDDIIDAMIEETTEDVQKFGGMEALDEPYTKIGFAQMMWKRAGWLCALFIGEMLTASAMQNYESELEKAVVLTLFIPLIMSSGGNSGSQATSLIIRALALREIELGDWWRVALRELPAGLALGAILGVIGMFRITLWQFLGFYDYGAHWPLIALTVGVALIGVVTFGSLSGSMLPFLLKRAGFDPASASAPLVATLVDVTGISIYFTVALVILRGTLL